MLSFIMIPQQDRYYQDCINENKMVESLKKKRETKRKIDMRKKNLLPYDLNSNDNCVIQITHGQLKEKNYNERSKTMHISLFVRQFRERNG